MHKLILFITALCVSFHPLLFGIVPKEISVEKMYYNQREKSKNKQGKRKPYMGHLLPPEGKMLNQVAQLTL